MVKPMNWRYLFLSPLFILSSQDETITNRMVKKIRIIKGLIFKDLIFKDRGRITIILKISFVIRVKLKMQCQLKN